MNDFEGWYPLHVYGAYSDIEQATNNYQSAERYSAEFVDKFKHLLAAIGERETGAFIMQLEDEQLMVVEKIRTGAVLGMTTFLGMRADSHSEAVQNAIDQDWFLHGPLAIKYLSLDNMKNLH